MPSDKHWEKPKKVNPVSITTETSAANINGKIRRLHLVQTAQIAWCHLLMRIPRVVSFMAAEELDIQ